MSVRELPSGRVQARLSIDGRPYSATFDSRSEAENWIVVTRARHITGTLPGRLTVAEYAARWMAGYDNAPINTRRFHRTNLDGWILPHLGRRPAAAVTPTDITRLLNFIHEQKSAAAAERVYRTLSVLFRSAEQDDVIARVPTRSKRHRPRRQKAPHVVLERGEARRMLLHMHGWERDAALLQLSLGTRFGEVAGLTPSDIDLRRGTVQIVRRVSSETVRANKNHRARMLELPTAARSTVERLVAEACAPEPLPDLQDREWPAGPWARRWLVQTATGRHANLSSLNKAIKAACRSADVPQLGSSHGLRHTYVSWMIDDGYTAEQVAFWIGDTPETVRKVYAHMLEASSRPAAESIDRALHGL